jgi:hypothetical protein
MTIGGIDVFGCIGPGGSPGCESEWRRRWAFPTPRKALVGHFVDYGVCAVTERLLR